MIELIDVLVVASWIAAMLIGYKVGHVKGFKEGSEYVLSRFKHLL